MIALVLALATVGLLLSAFFSGSETGVFRAARVRLVLDALGGDVVARALVWLVNRPGLFVATTLAGNNLANYLVSLSIVMGTQTIMGPGHHAAELVVPLVLAPVLFVYGELAPKNLFLHAPNHLLRLAGPPLIVFTILFLPVSLILWGLSKGIAWLMGQAPEQLRLALARRELQQALDEGHDVGILHPAQQRLAKGIFALAAEPVLRVAILPGELPLAQSDMSKEEILRLAKWHRLADVPIENAANGRELVGYVRVAELQLAPGEEIGPIHELLEIDQAETYLAALVQMENAGQTMARVVDSTGRTVGLLAARALRESLFHGRATAGGTTCDSPAT